ncbi:MAG: M36 family metallopeptidase [Roseiflexaceae bacterium]
MSREIDRRSFTSRKLTTERADELRVLAAADSDKLHADHRVSVASFDSTTGNPSAVLSEAAPAEQGNYVQRALDHVRGISSTLGLMETQSAEFVADPQYQQTSSGAVAVHLQQLYKGIPIFQAAQAVRFDPAGQLQDTVGRSVTVPADRPVAPKLRVQDAVLIAARQVATPSPEEIGETDQFDEPVRPKSVDLTGFTPTIITTFLDKPDRPTVLEAGPFADQIKASLIWFDLDGNLRLGWEVIITLPGYTEQYRTIVDSETGEVLYCHQLVPHIAARGNVYRRDGGSMRQMVDFPLPLGTYGLPIPGNLPNGFPDTWVDADLAEGNCVYAHLDDDGPTIRGIQNGDAVVFDPAEPQGNAQRILNLFYLNCYMHNFFYLLGFREQDGNFQRDNFGRGGAASDSVDARAYAGAVDGTASMFTPSDGKRAIMQMGLVTSTGRHTALDSSVVFHEYTHGVTNRLIGGPMNIRPLDAIQSQSMGEGWSDYAACTANSSTVVGAWVVGKPGGIRIAPYDDSYPGHFGKIGADPYTKIHNIGEIWCAALLQMNRNIGANEGLQLVVDALRLTQANPSLLEARDAILRALDHKHIAGQLSDAQYVAAHGGVWRAFAKFGMGVNAQCDDARTLTGIVADFSIPDGVEPQPQPQPEPAPGAAVHVESAPALAIPDADPNGITSTLTITQVGQIQHLSIWLDIQHTYIGDLEVSLSAPAGEPIVLHTVSDDSTNDLIRSYTSEDTPALAALAGQSIQGSWTLKVADLAAEDVGVLHRWGLDITVAAAFAAVPEMALSPREDESIADDLKLINGIKTGMERRLHSVGIRTYAKIAAMTPAELAAAVGMPGYSAERIAKQDWIGQARELAGLPLSDAEQPAQTEVLAGLVDLHAEEQSDLAPREPGQETAEPVSRQHYEMFNVQLLLDENNEVRRTHVVHFDQGGLQKGGEDTWAGWEDGRLVSFFVEQAALRSRPAQQTTDAADELNGLDGSVATADDLEIEVDELLIDDPADVEEHEETATVTALHAQVRFRVHGPSTDRLASNRTTYFVHVLAHIPDSSQTIVLGAFQGELHPEEREYTTAIDFTLPEAGRYQLLATVVLVGSSTPGVAMGPWLTVLP